MLKSVDETIFNEKQPIYAYLQEEGACTDKLGKHTDFYTYSTSNCGAKPRWLPFGSHRWGNAHTLRGSSVFGTRRSSCYGFTVIRRKPDARSQSLLAAYVIFLSPMAGLTSIWRLLNMSLCLSNSKFKSFLTAVFGTGLFLKFKSVCFLLKTK